MFDKVRSGGVWGTLAAFALVLLQGVFPDLRIPADAAAEDIVIAVLTYLVPIVVGTFAAWLKTERKGYGSQTTVVTTEAGNATKLIFLPVNGDQDPRP